MRMYTVRMLKEAVADLERLDKNVAQRLTDRIRWLVENLDQMKHEPLRGDLAGFYKLRGGDYRIITEAASYRPAADYQILNAEEAVIIHAIGHRREIYRKR